MGSKPHLLKVQTDAMPTSASSRKRCRHLSIRCAMQHLKPAGETISLPGLLFLLLFVLQNRRNLMKNQAQQANYFNFTADAVAYVNEVKTVQPRNGNVYIAIRASILEGLDGKNKISCDLTIRGQQADEVLRMFADAWPQGYGSRSPKWFAGIRIGSIESKSFFRGNGQPGSTLSGRLLAIKWLKIDGEDMEIPEWRTESADAKNYGEEPADTHAEGDDYTDDTAPQQPPQPRGQRPQPQPQQQQRYQGQAQRQPQAR